MFAVASTSSAAAQGEDGDRITSSDYTIDLYKGTVHGSARMVGLGGAFVAIGEGVDGNLVNAATAALRPGYSVDHFDYWLGFALTSPFSVGDAFNTGGFASEGGFDQSGFHYLAPSVNLQWGPFGVGLTFELTEASMNSSGRAASGIDDSNLRVQMMTARLQTAYQLIDDQFMVGVGAIFVVQRILGGQGLLEQQELFVTDGFSFEVGAIYRPNEEHYRLGASFEGQVDTSRNGDDVIAEGFYLPRGIYKPWELRFGGAYQFGVALNRVWRDVDAVVHDEVGDLWDSMSDDARALYTRETWRRLRREYRAQPRHYLLTTVALHLIGQADAGVSVESFLVQRVQRSGGDVSFSVRWGLETDLIPNWVAIRYGNYIEPSRVAQTNPRFHYTFGVDVKLGWWDVFGIWSEDYLWRLGLSADIARSYAVWSLGIGGWY